MLPIPTRDNPLPDGQHGEALCVVRDVEKTFHRGVWPWRRSLTVLRSASLTLRPGEIVGLVGANGSGKSTLMRIVAGVLRADRGEVAVHGSVGYCPQQPVLYEKLTVDETFRLFGAAYGLPPARVESRTRELADQLGFAAFHDRIVEDLSGGTREKLNLSIALLPDPELLLLDEPYAGFDYDTYLKFWDLSERVRASGAAILIVSHFVHERSRFDRILRVDGGLVSDG